MKKHHIQIIYGQGGKGPLSEGMIRYHEGLRSVGYTVDDSVSAQEPSKVVDIINALEEGTKVILIGYSLGGNALTWVASGNYGNLNKDVDLMVAYDPTWLTFTYRLGENVKKAIVYKAYGLNPAGHGNIEGDQVEIVKVIEDHLMVCWDQRLHDRTTAEIQRLLTDD